MVMRSGLSFFQVVLTGCTEFFDMDHNGKNDCPALENKITEDGLESM